MNTSSLLFRNFIKGLVAAPPKRKLYTDSIYPYPKSYFNNKVYPSRTLYRETWHMPPPAGTMMTEATWIMRFFWTYFFWMLFHNPEVLIGHYDIPDPANFTDKELGIPPEDSGLYSEWFKQKYDAED